MVINDAVWNLWQIPMGESQCRPMGFWSKVMPSAEENHNMLFEKQLMVCYLALLIIGHK